MVIQRNADSNGLEHSSVQVDGVEVAFFTNEPGPTKEYAGELNQPLRGKLGLDYRGILCAIGREFIKASEALDLIGSKGK